MEDYEFEILELTGKLLKATSSLLAVPGFATALTFAELFASRRAAGLPEKIHAMWEALCVLEPEQAVIKPPCDATRFVLELRESNDVYMQRRMDAANEDKHA